MKNRWGTIPYLLPYVLIAQASIMSSARTEEADTIASTEKAASVLILGMNGETWDRALIWSLIAAAIAAVLVGLTTAGSIITHKREAEAAEAGLARYKETVAEKVAEARTEGINAGKTAGDAQVRAGEANERAAKAEERAAQANERASAADLARARLEARLAPRKLSEEQKNIMKKIISENPVYTQIDVISEGSPEAVYYAEQFVNFLKNIGLKSDMYIQNFASGALIPGPIYVRNDPAGIIQKMLRYAHFSYVYSGDYEGIVPCFVISPRPIDD